MVYSELYILAAPRVVYLFLKVAFLGHTLIRYPFVWNAIIDENSNTMLFLHILKKSSNRQDHMIVIWWACLTRLLVVWVTSPALSELVTLVHQFSDIYPKEHIYSDH